MSKTSDTKYLNALYAKSWITLIAYNKLLFSWQHQFNDPKTIRQLATVASHKRRMHHFCGDNCEVVDSILHYGTGAITKGANQTEIAKSNANSSNFDDIS